MRWSGCSTIRETSVRRINPYLKFIHELLIAEGFQDAVFGGLNVSEVPCLMRSVRTEFILARPLAKVEMEIHGIDH
jgi:hypothetical protein